MKQRKYEFAHVICFKEQTPDMQIEKVVFSPLYEKAFLSRDAETDSDFKQNTATWD